MLLLTFSVLLVLELGPLENLHLSKFYLGSNILMLNELKSYTITHIFLT